MLFTLALWDILFINNIIFLCIELLIKDAIRVSKLQQRKSLASVNPHNYRTCRISKDPAAAFLNKCYNMKLAGKTL